MVVTVVSVVLSAFFIFASSIKIFGWQKYIFETQLSFFHKYGLNRTIMRLVGVIEAGSASLILIQLIFGVTPQLLVVGALGIAGTSLGAIFFHLRFDTWKDGVPALVTLGLSTYLLLNFYTI